MPSEARVYSYSAVLMGSPILLKLFEDNQPVAAAVFRLIKQQEDLLTVNRAHSQIMSINQAAGRHPVVVSPPVFRLIQRARAVSLLENSSFNFTIGPLVKRWKIGFQGNSVPPQHELQALLALTNPANVILNANECSVLLEKPGMEIDLGAIAKGYIADLVRDLLQRQQIRHALINLGGNVQTLGAPPHGEQNAWAIGLKKPFADAEAMIGVINVAGKSVVTSGIYERYFELDGRLYHHILDPRTGYPLDNELLSVTIISEDSIDGDIYTTLLYGMGVEQGLAYAASLPHIEAIFVTKTKRVHLSSQRQFRFTLLDDSYTLA
ncbi:FAD:protein FMN transferase [Gibbsiella dentisursi]|uniref:FAD:protein FMN transferase n=1 Tax=Gibbsiella dentisursi TaxID=796890 RepID=A0ABP7LDR8_9GAMM